MKAERERVKVLVTDGGYKNTLAAVKALSREGCEVAVIGSSRHDLSVLSKYCDKAFIYDQAYFLQGLKRAIQVFKPDVLLPISERAVIQISQVLPEIRGDVKIPLPTKEVLETATNKISVNKLLQENGIPVPEFTVIGSLDELEASLDRVTFPIVLKGPRGSGSSEVAICHSREACLKEGEELLKRHPEIMVQRYIRGKGTGYFGAFHKGREISFFMHERIHEYPLSGGPSTAARSVYERDLHVLGRKVLEFLEWNGVAMVEFKREEGTGKLWFIEVNPKFWGSLELGIASGVNFPFLATLIANNAVLPVKKGYKLGIVFKWVFPFEILYLHAHRYSLRVLFEVLYYDPRRVKTDVSLKDPLPTVWNMYVTIKRLLSSIIRR